MNDMDNLSAYGLALLLFFSISCGQQESQAVKSIPVEEKSEDDIFMQLSRFLTVEPTTQAELDQNAIVNYAIDNVLYLERTPSGVFYKVSESGMGDSIEWADYLVADYKGQLLDGTEFDSSYKKGKPLSFYVGNMIKGWNEALQMFTVGSKVTLIIPSHLAYGESGITVGNRTLVPPNAPLLFEINILEKKPTGPN